MKTIALLCALAGALTAAGNPALADDKATAEAHFRSAEAHFQAGNFRAAIAGYTDSYALFPAPILLFNIGLCHEKLDEKQQAIDKYREYLASEPTGARSAEARTRAGNLERLIEAERNAAENEKRAAIAEKKAAVATLRGEGKHAELAAALAELYDLEPDAELIFEIAAAHEQAGERARAVEQYDRYLATEAPSRADEARRRRDALKQPVVTGPGPRPIDPGAERPSMLLPIAASSVTLVTFAVGAFFGFSSATLRGELEDTSDEVDPPLDNSDPRFDDGETNAKIANVMFAASAVTAAVSGYLWYRFISKSRETSAATSMSVAPTRGGAVAGVEVRF